MWHFLPHYLGNGKSNGSFWLKDRRKNLESLQTNGYNISNRNSTDRSNASLEMPSNATYNTVVAFRNSSESGAFILNPEEEVSEASVVCRVSPNFPIGIQTLNLMLDPSKANERKEKVGAAKNKFNDDFGQLDISKSYEKLFELLWYARLPCFDVKDVTSQQRDEMSVIKRCYWRGQMVDCSSIFVTRTTDRGMCCSFNQVDADRIYKNTKYRQTLQARQGIDKQLSFQNATVDTRYIIL